MRQLAIGRASADVASTSDTGAGKRARRRAAAGWRSGGVCRFHVIGSSSARRHLRSALQSFMSREEFPKPGSRGEHVKENQ